MESKNGATCAHGCGNRTGRKGLEFPAFGTDQRTFYMRKSITVLRAKRGTNNSPKKFVRRMWFKSRVDGGDKRCGYGEKSGEI